MHVRTNCTRYI